MTTNTLHDWLRNNPDLAELNSDLYGPLPDVEPRNAPATSEEDEQARVVTWANDNLERWPELAFLHHSPNGGWRHKGTAARLKQMGVRPGYPDLVLPLRRGCYVGIAVEMKAGKNRPTETQLRWIDHLARQGWYCSVQWSADAAIAELRWYLGLGIDHAD